MMAAGSMHSHLVLNTRQGQIIQQIMAQYYQGEKARNMLMLNILSECAAVLSAPGLDARDTFCSKVLDSLTGMCACERVWARAHARENETDRQRERREPVRRRCRVVVVAGAVCVCVCARARAIASDAKLVAVF
jgi:hypothetical protein